VAGLKVRDPSRRPRRPGVGHAALQPGRCEHRLRAPGPCWSQKGPPPSRWSWRPGPARPAAPGGAASSGRRDYPIRRILTSPTLRWHQTLQPLAPDCHLRVEREVASGVDAERARVLALLEVLRAQDAVVCTHGEVIKQVLTRLVADGLMVDRPSEWPKGRPGCWTGPTGDSRMPAPLLPERFHPLGVMRRAWLADSPVVVKSSEALNGRCGADGREEDCAPQRR
jgi:hypothetical protein